MPSPALGSVNFLSSNAGVSAPAKNQRSTCQSCRPIHEGRPEPGAERTCDNNAKHTESRLVGMCQMGGWWNYDFAWQRNERALDSHKQHDEGISPRYERRQIPADQAFEHGGVRYTAKPATCKRVSGQECAIRLSIGALARSFSIIAGK